MSRKTQAYFLIGLLVLLLVVILFDPRIPAYRSTYEDPASAQQVAKWAEDIKAWPRSPTWDHFSEHRNPHMLRASAPVMVVRATGSRS